jgi:hypothetical protein
VSRFVIPRPQYQQGASPGPDTNYLDPSQPDDPTPAQPPDGNCDESGDDGSSGEAGTGKAITIGKEALEAAKNGKDLLDARTWKNILENEWVEAAEAGSNVQAALNGDVVALVEVLDYAFEQITGVGFFETLQVLKGADYLGLGWYDDAIGFIQQLKYFPELAQASGDFANTIDDLGVLYDASKLGQRADDSQRVYRLMDGNAREVFGNFSTKYANRPPSGQILDIIEFGDPSNPTRLILRRSSTDNNLPTIEIQGPFGPSDSYREIRFGSF